tara:strand:+ start:205 stop:630 length:426 start_codon:yes stop_codon:yes gene_type:complete
MDLDKINEMWEKDSVIDDTLIDSASIRIPQLHQKYLNLLSEFTLLQKKKTQELKKAQHYKFLYYSGKLPPEDYEDAPFPYKVLKGEAWNWVYVDEQIQNIELKIEYYNVVLRNLEEILKQVHQMSYNIKNVIEWRRFVGGM